MRNIWNKITKSAKAFVYVFKNSLYNFKYYPEILKTPVKFSLKYYLGLVLLITTVSAIAFSIENIPKSIKTMNNYYEQAIRMYPDDLIFTVKEGKWQINREQPFSIEMPKDLQEEDQEMMEVLFTEIPQYLITFDQNGTINQMKELNTVIMVNENNILVNASEGSTSYPISSLLPLENFENFQFTKTEFVALVENIKQVPYIYPFIVFALDLFSLLTLGTVHVFAVTVLVWMLSLMGSIGLKFGHALRFVMHAATPIYLLQSVLGILKLYIPFPATFFILHLVFVAVVMYMMKTEKNEAKKQR